MARYINADALKSRMLNYYDCVNENTGKENYRGETLMAYEVADMIEDCIDNAPTADVVPRAEVDRFLDNFVRTIEVDAKIGLSAGEILLHINNMLVALKKKLTGE